jgi:hypothetical protein
MISCCCDREAMFLLAEGEAEAEAEGAESNSEHEHRWHEIRLSHHERRCLDTSVSGCSHA